MASPAQKITLTSASPRRSVTALRGQTPPVITDGYGGWTLISRPHRLALTEWVGVNPFALAVSLLFDESVNRNVEDDIATLEQMALPAGTSPPPVVTVAGVVPHRDKDWVIGNLAWDPAPIYGAAGRVRHEVTVTLLEHVSADTIPSAAAAARGQVATATKPYTVKKGDTLVSIAARQLGDYTRWPEIATLNGLRDPNRLTVGQRLRLP
jgi:nucleoid-associated protein YgaU